MNVLLAAAFAIAAVDGLTKQLASAHLVEGRMYGVGGGWGLRLVHNERGALTRLPMSAGVALWLLVAAAAASLVRAAPAASGTSLALGLGLFVGGAFGNLVDRLRRRPAIDFVAAGPWPVFNIADAALVVGFVIALASAA